MIGFLKAEYLGIGREVKVDDEYTDSFEVTTGLWQGSMHIVTFAVFAVH